VSAAATRGPIVGGDLLLAVVTCVADVGHPFDVEVTCDLYEYEPEEDYGLRLRPTGRQMVESVHWEHFGPVHIGQRFTLVRLGDRLVKASELEDYLRCVEIDADTQELGVLVMPVRGVLGDNPPVEVAAR
jgi:hypothetical protein